MFAIFRNKPYPTPPVKRVLLPAGPTIYARTSTFRGNMFELVKGTSCNSCGK